MVFLTVNARMGDAWQSRLLSDRAPNRSTIIAVIFLRLMAVALMGLLLRANESSRFYAIRSAVACIGRQYSSLRASLRRERGLRMIHSSAGIPKRRRAHIAVHDGGGGSLSA